MESYLFYIFHCVFILISFFFFSLSLSLYCLLEAELFYSLFIYLFCLRYGISFFIYFSLYIYFSISLSLSVYLKQGYFIIYYLWGCSVLAWVFTGTHAQFYRKLYVVAHWLLGRLVFGKQYRPRSDAAEQFCGVWSGSTLFYWLF